MANNKTSLVDLIDKQINGLLKIKERFLLENDMCRTCYKSPISKDMANKKLGLCDKCLDEMARGYNGGGW